MTFLDRVHALPALGIGVSTEYGAGDQEGGLDLLDLRARHPRYAGFLEVGVDTLSGLDRHARAWAAEGLPTTYHFLDLNLAEPEDLDADWLDDVREIATVLRPAWICGDAGIWHFGKREPGQMLLLPPILSMESASCLAEGIERLRAATGFEVLPENPPGAVFLGDLHLLDLFARVLEAADTGMVLDCAHLAIYQRTRRLLPLTALDALPLDRVVELHVAGGTERSLDGYPFVHDDHGVGVLSDTWQIFEHVAPLCPNLKAVVFECERNRLPDTLPVFERIDAVLGRAAPGATRGMGGEPR